MSNTNPLTRSSISADLSLLQSLPSSTLISLVSPSSSRATPIATSTNDQSAPSRPIDVLDSFSPSHAADHEKSQALVRAYIDEMNAVKAMGEDGDGDKVGERIDRLREKGEEIVDVLGEIKV
ncbi:hypothetical protein IAR55_006840 [Kwoniella newhampshirensis]|uniref:Uncharacterized protein n=1 Tax=Kwoniella newhampshirensis TaxID=1651941 RepID=A0AAW0YDI9_9TREE